MHRLLAGLLRELGLLDLVLKLGQLILAFLVAEFLLDGLHLLVEVVLALGLLHLALDARADALLDLQHGDFALHQAEHFFQPFGNNRRLQDRLLVGNLHRQMRSNRVGELGVILDLLNDADNLGRHFLVELHIAFELGDHRARHGFRLNRIADGIADHDGISLVIVAAVGVLHHLRALSALDQHLHGTVGQLEQLQHARERSYLEDRVRSRIVVGGVLLRRQQNESVGTHHLFERADGLLAANEERHDHVREIRRCRAKATPDRPGFHREREVGAAFQKA